MDRRDFLKITGGTVLAAGSCAYAARYLTATNPGRGVDDIDPSGKKWGMVIDLDRCQEGCTECLQACRFENNVSDHGDNRWDVHWLRKVKVKKEAGGQTITKPVLLLCNHCDHPPCAQVCPVQATYKRDDGIVIVDHHRCIGCRYCMIACPYNARFFNFKDDEDWPNKERPKRSHGVAESCTLCAHRLDEGLEPACVEACKKAGPGAIAVGDLNEAKDPVAKMVATKAVKRIREELGTAPKVYYMGL